MWYFGENGQQQGPVSLAELQVMVRSGRLTLDTLVWRQGMSDWMPVQGVPELRLEADLAKRGKVGVPPSPRPVHVSVSPPAGAPSPGGVSAPMAGASGGVSSTARSFPSGANAGSVPAAPTGPAAPAVDFPDDSAPRPLRPLAPAAGTGHCVKCGAALPAESPGVDSGSGQGLCATCREAFAASLDAPSAGGTESSAAAMAAMPSSVMYYQYGGFLPRFAATFCDGVILWLASLIVSLGLNFGFGLVGAGFGGDAGAMVTFLGMLAGALLGGVLLPSVYYGYFLSTQGATPGKKLLGLAVIRPDGGGVSFVRGMCRYWATSLSGIICGIGYLMALFDDEKRALHDHICDTRVVSTR